ncbi:MAG: hypothetical protein QOH50_626 [Kribbellaceae bacterium]|nr:hypothetical protein [Kribbellaceae bacterium]
MATDGTFVAGVASQLPALIGVVVGSVLSYGGGALTERSKRKRSQEVRWDARRVEAYSEYAAAVKRQTRLCQRMAAARGMGPRSDPLDVTAAAPLLAQVREVRSVAIEAVLLLGDNATVSAAHDWNFAVSDLAHLLVDTEATESEFLELFHRVNTQRDHFYTAARNSLQVATDRLDPTPFFHWRSPDDAD